MPFKVVKVTKQEERKQLGLNAIWGPGQGLGTGKGQSWKNLQNPNKAPSLVNNNLLMLRLPWWSSG